MKGVITLYDEREVLLGSRTEQFSHFFGELSEPYSPVGVDEVYVNVSGPTSVMVFRLHNIMNGQAMLDQTWVPTNTSVYIVP